MVSHLAVRWFLIQSTQCALNAAERTAAEGVINPLLVPVGAPAGTTAAMPNPMPPADYDVLRGNVETAVQAVTGPTRTLPATPAADVEALWIAQGRPGAAVAPVVATAAGPGRFRRAGRWVKTKAWDGKRKLAPLGLTGIAAIVAVCLVWGFPWTRSFSSGGLDAQTKQQLQEGNAALLNAAAAVTAMPSAEPPK